MKEVVKLLKDKKWTEKKNGGSESKKYSKREPTVVEVCQKKNKKKTTNYNYKTTSQTQKHDFPN